MVRTVTTLIGIGLLAIIVLGTHAPSAASSGISMSAQENASVPAEQGAPGVIPGAVRKVTHASPPSKLSARGWGHPSWRGEIHTAAWLGWAATATGTATMTRQVPSTPLSLLDRLADNKPSIWGNKAFYVILALLYVTLLSLLLYQIINLPNSHR